MDDSQNGGCGGWGGGSGVVGLVLLPTGNNIIFVFITRVASREARRPFSVVD